jgi:periplasmic protein TonB
MGPKLRQAAFWAGLGHLLLIVVFVVLGQFAAPTPPQVIQVVLQPNQASDQRSSITPAANEQQKKKLPVAVAAPTTIPAPKQTQIKTPQPVTPPVSISPPVAENTATVAVNPAAAPAPAPAAPTPPATSPSAVPNQNTAESATPQQATAAITPSAAGSSLAATDRQPTADARFSGNAAPSYPAMSRRLGEQGAVRLRVLITTEGRAARVELIQSSGYARLDQSAIQAIRSWRFIPAQRAGQPIEAWYEWRWEFRLDG